jgi:acyl-coenzyme A synthetase/AMP-(fatty) acid ligase
MTAPALPFTPLDRLLDAHRQRFGAKPAIVDVDTGARIGFDTLAGAVDAIAARLVDLGVQRGDRVMLVGDNGLDKLLMWLGAWRIGAVVCPVDLTFIGAAATVPLLAAIDPVRLLCSHETRVDALPAPWRDRVVAWGRGTPPGGAPDALPDTGPIDLAQIMAAPGAGATPLPPAPGPDDLAAMCCTSGTTGLPKIIVYDHAAYWFNGLSGIDFLNLSADDRWLEFRSFNWYSAQILSLLPFLQTGMTLHVARRFSRSRFPHWIAAHGMTGCAAVPAVINILLADDHSADAPDLKCLRIMTSSTGPLSPVQWQRFEARFGVPLMNLYGSSETGWVAGNRPGRHTIGTVGQRALHADVSIVDVDGLPCAAGEEGQIVASGIQLAIGQWTMDGKLLPIRGAPYRTRDVAVEDDAGFLRIVGRSDDLIIRGGVKMLPQEIEDVLLSFPGVIDAAAMGRPDAIFGQEVVGFVVQSPTAPFDADALLAYAAARLPNEKTPKEIIVVDALPRSDRGKLLRDRLKALWWTATQGDTPQDDLD